MKTVLKNVKKAFVNIVLIVLRVLSAAFKKFKSLKKPVKIAVCLLLVCAVAASAFGIKKITDAKKTASDNTAQTSVVMQGSIQNSITGSGTVEPIEQRDIVPLVNGKITMAPFEEGDEVSEGDILYKFEMTSAENAIKTAQNSVKSAQNSVTKAQTSIENKSSDIQKAKENVANLTIYAPSSGRVSDLNLQIGEEVSGAVCKITNYKDQRATIAFGAAQIAEISVGDSATVSIDKYMMNVSGTVTKKYSAPTTSKNGSVVYNVEIKIDDGLTLEENTEATAVVHTSSGDVSSAEYGEIEYASPVTVNAKQRGTVTKVNVRSGDWIDKGDIIAVLENSDTTDALRTANQSYSEAKMSLSDAQSQLENSISTLEDKEENAENYIVTSPINGVVLTKDYTVGDTVSGQNATTMMVVADLSKMKFTISVDELDIAKIQVGQSVEVTADALENQRIEGEITALSKLGTSSNGVTTYPVEVTINDPGDLMPGMNVSAEIIVEEAENALYLPVSAVEYFGGKYYVTVVGEVENMPAPEGLPDMEKTSKGEEGDNQKFGGEENTDSKQGEQSPPGGQTPPEGMERPSEMREDEETGSDTQKTNKTARSGQKPSEMKIKLTGKEERVEVEIGISNDDYYEIKSGVSLGQVVKNTTQTTSSSGTTNNMGGMPGGGMLGGMPGGGMPGGGMPGGGNMGGNRR